MSRSDAPPLSPYILWNILELILEVVPSQSPSPTGSPLFFLSGLSIMPLKLDFCHFGVSGIGAMA